MWVRRNAAWVRVSIREHRGGWEVRWRDAAGRNRAKRFASEEAAQEYDAALSELSPAARRFDTARFGRGGGVYPYETGRGIRWRFVYRRSDGTQTSKRGFASERAARDARRRLIEQVERGEVRHTKETFADYWERWLARASPTSNRAPGLGTRSTAARSCCPPSAGDPLDSCRSTRSVTSSPSSRRRSKPVSSPPRRSTTRS
jgi:hypothetical protein